MDGETWPRRSDNWPGHSMTRCSWATLRRCLVHALITGAPPPAIEVTDPQLSLDLALLGWLRRR